MVSFEDLYKQYAKLVFTVANRIVLSVPVAEEIVQETFIRCFGKLSEIRQENPKYWLVKVATNLSLDEIRRRRSRGSDLFSTLSRTFPLFTTTIGTRVSNRQRSQLILEKLSSDERALVVLRLAYDYSYSEIADILELPEGTVKSRISRLLEKLREEVKEVE